MCKAANGGKRDNFFFEWRNIFLCIMERRAATGYAVTGARLWLIPTFTPGQYKASLMRYRLRVKPWATVERNGAFVKPLRRAQFESSLKLFYSRCLLEMRLSNINVFQLIFRSLTASCCALGLTRHLRSLMSSPSNLWMGDPLCVDLECPSFNWKSDNAQLIDVLVKQKTETTPVQEERWLGQF